MTLFGKRADMVVHEVEPFNAEPAPAALAASFLTPVDTFYSRNHGAVPDIDPSAWRLTIDRPGRARHSSCRWPSCRTVSRRAR